MSDIKQYIYLIPQRDPQGTVSWNWIYNGQTGSAANFPPVIVDHGPNDLFFTILDPQNSIKFAGYPSDVSKAFYLAPKSSGPQPTKQPGINDPGKDFPGFGMQQDGTQLTVTDKNGKKSDFVYQLNFTDSANGKAVTSIDPEIRNGDGGSSGLQVVSYYVAAVLISAAISILFVRYALNWRRAG